MAAYRRLFIWVEGTDDKRFVDYIIKPLLQELYDFIEVREYARLKDSKLQNFVKSIKAMGADYWLLADINTAPCIDARKRKIIDKFKAVDPACIIVVIKEIESWYLAGIDNKAAQSLKIKSFRNTDELDKEKFLALIPANFDSKVDFLNELLKHFSLEAGMEKNQSFKYFIDRLKN
ncbi:hypothetical protein [Caldithrix abyssi]